MAGSYNHVVSERGRLLDSTIMHEQLDTFGDVWETIEELFGMIWLLALGDPDRVEWARTHIQAGIALSPGYEEEV